MSDEKYVKLGLLRKCPQLMGVDHDRYRLFEVGDKVEIPEDNAEVLLNQGIVERRGDG